MKNCNGNTLDADIIEQLKQLSEDGSDFIRQLEQSKRGIYGGAIGYLDFAGNLDTCIAIRLVYKKNGEICIRSGAGIVADSVPEKEFEECCNKAKAVRVAIERAEEGLE